VDSVVLTASGLITPASPAVQNRRVASVAFSAATAGQVRIRDGGAAGTIKASIRGLAGDTRDIGMEGVTFFKDVYVEFVSGTGEVTVVFGA
jgi:hypothetical protein